jgi:hypothetical protein
MEKRIFSTNNYSEFTFFEGNRMVDNSRVKQLMESIKSNGLINPIVVTQNLEIIDGQHRTEALKNLGLPILYHIHNVDRDKLLDLVRNINSVQKNWSNYDIARAYALHSPNKIHYQRYLNLVELGITHASAIEACGYLTAADPNNPTDKKLKADYKKFKNGNLEIDVEVYNKVRGFIGSLIKSPIEKSIWNKAHFIRALLHLRLHYNLNVNMFFDKYKNNPYKWKNASTYDEHKRSMVSLYNHANKKPIEVVFK